MKDLTDKQVKDLTDKQVLAGVAALQETEKKFKGQTSDQEVVRAVYFAILEAADPIPTYYG